MIGWPGPTGKRSAPAFEKVNFEPHYVAAVGDQPMIEDGAMPVGRQAARFGRWCVHGNIEVSCGFDIGGAYRKGLVRLGNFDAGEFSENRKRRAGRELLRRERVEIGCKMDTGDRIGLAAALLQ